jgi:hypothetical protein
MAFVPMEMDKITIMNPRYVPNCTHQPWANMKLL